MHVEKKLKMNLMVGGGGFVLEEGHKAPCFAMAISKTYTGANLTPLYSQLLFLAEK